MMVVVGLLVDVFLTWRLYCTLASLMVYWVHACQSQNSLISRLSVYMCSFRSHCLLPCLSSLSYCVSVFPSFFHYYISLPHYCLTFLLTLCLPA